MIRLPPSRLAVLALALVPILALAGCGQRGPLYLPGQPLPEQQRLEEDSSGQPFPGEPTPVQPRPEEAT